LTTYWFVSGNAVVGSNWSRFAHDGVESAHPCPRRRWAYVLLQTDANDGEAAALARHAGRVA